MSDVCVQGCHKRLPVRNDGKVRERWGDLGRSTMVLESHDQLIPFWIDRQIQRKNTLMAEEARAARRSHLLMTRFNQP